jgi:hypothetical protein
MTAEPVPVQFLQAGDVIRVSHHHDSRDGECRSRWETDAVVTESPAPVGGRLAVRWAGDARLPGSRAAVTGVSVFGPDERVTQIGRLPASTPSTDGPSAW